MPYLFFLLLVLFILPLNSYSDDTVPVTDTVVVDSAIVVADSVVLHKQFGLYGNIFVASDTISYHSIPSHNYTTLADILYSDLDFVTPLSTGIAGNANAYSAFGALSSENGLLLNGVSIGSIYGVANMEAVSPEFVSNIEILFGSKSAVVAGKSGSVVNIQTPKFDTKLPYSRIWYTQGDNKLIGVDATYSQNFMPNWNITAGFRRLSANSFYANSFVNSWNGRIELRHNISALSVISLLYHFTNYEQGDFGGVLFLDYNTNNNSPNETRSNFSNLADRQYNTDVILSYWQSADDTSLVFNANAFFKHKENNILFASQKELLMIDSSGRNIARAVDYGVNSYLCYSLLENVKLDAGGEIGYNNVPMTLLNSQYDGVGASVYGNATATMGDALLSVGARIARKYGQSLFSAGARADKNFAQNLLFSADVSLCNTEPIPVLSYLNERHILGVVNANKRSGSWNMNVSGFYRAIDNPIQLDLDRSNIYNSSIATGSTMNIYGIVGKVDIEIVKNLVCKVKFNAYVEDSDAKCLLSGLAQYSYVKGVNYVSGGIRCNVLMDGSKYYYNPVYKYYSQVDTEDRIEFDGIGAFISAKFGNAYVRASFDNLLGSNFSYLAYYPIQKQAFSLSLTWAFLDGK
jgi:hypothetical protein